MRKKAARRDLASQENLLQLPYLPFDGNRV